MSLKFCDFAYELFTIESQKFLSYDSSDRSYIYARIYDLSYVRKFCEYLRARKFLRATKTELQWIALQTRPTNHLGLRQVRGLCLVVDLSARSRYVRTLSVGLVWSGRRQSPWSIWHGPDLVGDQVAGADMSGRVGSGVVVRVVEFRNDTTRPDQRQSLVGTVPNSTTRTRTRPDPTRLDKIRGLVGDPSGPNGLCLRPGSDAWLSDKVLRRF